MDHRTSARLSTDDAREGLISGEQDDSNNKRSLNGWAQFKLIMGKNARLKWRSGSDFCCETLAPLILIFGMSCLSLTVHPESHDASPFFTSTIRDASFEAFISDRQQNLNGLYDRTHLKNHVGKILFATNNASLSNLTTELCHQVHANMTEAHSEYTANNSPYGPVLMDNWQCGNDTVFSSTEELDAQAVSYASDGHWFPIIGGVVVNSWSDSEGVDYSMRFNRSYVERTSYDVNAFTFYPSSFWLQYSTSGFSMLQRWVDGFFLSKLVPGNPVLEPLFQSFPHQDWKYDPFKYNFLSGNFQQFFGYCIIFALSTLTKSIVDERKRKIKEGMLMMGLRSWVFWGTWVCTYFLIFLFVALSTTAASYVFIFSHSNFLLVFSFVLLFLLSVVTLALFLSTLFTDPGAASISAIFFYLACIFTPQALVGLSTTARTCFCLLSPMAFYWGFSVFGAYEGSNQGVTFSNFHEAQEATRNSLLLKDVMGMMALDTVLYLMLAWYCDKVIPGDFGAKQPWYFLLSPSYWCQDDTPVDAGPVADVPIDEKTGRRLTARARGDVEEVSSTEVPCVKIERLRKVFVSNGITKVAVEEMNLDVYESQVTALLGHNGAGKSTTFNMLTGLMKPTSGDANIYGLSVSEQLDRVRLLLGVCPQHDVLWDQLTVLEHLELFGALKGIPEHELRDRAYEVISAVGLTEKTEQFSCTLSGGMKRKLSIGIAVIGGSRVVFLDEPTSGMDPYSRRSSWEIIKSYKQGRVMLFTTHFMDEADLLGDRIAIMSEGRLRCCGSSLFLKKRFGLGYNLTISMRVGAKNSDQPIRELVCKHAPGSSVLSDQGASLSFQVPFEQLPQFPMMFDELDAGKETLEIDSWGISMTTLEEVFLKLAHMKHADDAEAREEDAEAVRASRRTRETADSDDSRRKTLDAELGQREDGVGSFGQHVVALFKKRLKTSLRDRMNWVLQVVVPMLFLLTALIAVTYGIDMGASDITLSLSEYNSPLQIPYSGPLNSQTTAGVSAQFVDASGAANAMFACDAFTDGTGTQAYPWNNANLKTLKNKLQGVVHSQTIVNSTDWTRTAPQYLKGKCPIREVELTNFLIESIDHSKSSRYGAYVWADDTFTPDAPSRHFLVMHNDSAYHAIPTFANLASQLILNAHSTSQSSPKISTSIDLLAMTDREKASNDTIKGLVLCFFLIIAFSIIPSSFVYSLVSEVASKAKHQQMISGVNPTAYWLSSFAWDFINYLLPAACSIALLYAFNVKAYIGDNIGATVTVFLLYGTAAIGLTYVLSFGFKDQNNALLACIALYAVSGFVLFFVSFVMGQFDSTKPVDDKLRYIYMFSPQYSFAMALYEIFGNSSLKQYSSAFEFGCAGKMMLYMALSSGAYLVLTLLLQHSSTSQGGCFSKLFHQSPEVPPDPEYVHDQDVLDEASFLDRPNSVDPAHTPIIVRHLRKVYYGRGNTKAKVAVRDLSFHVPEGQVFGFLGINGAGKTTSLSMLSGEFPPTEGEGLLNGLDMLTHREEINRSMGYCPQFDALFGKLTGREHLQMYARIKGIPKQDELSVVEAMIRTMDLTDHCDREAGGYSGGNKRKLSVAIALMGSPRIVFLDEPSTGMDPEARRFMWNVISNTMVGRSVILTTHSMEEAEALAHNIGIMVGGRLRCLGTTQHLKNKYGKGYSVELRTSDERVEQAMQFMASQFPTSEIEEQIGGQCRYQIPQDDIKLSAAFRELQQNKAALGLADFCVSQTTLEQVFVKFAAEQEEETGADAAALAKAVQADYPNFSEMCLCRPKDRYEWTVPGKDGHPTSEISIQFPHAITCCSRNSGSVHLNGQHLDHLCLDEVSAPGCPDAPCVGCRNGCCGCTGGTCCMPTSHVFAANGRTFEVVPFNEVPFSKRAHPCFLFVDGKEANTGFDRNMYLEHVFCGAAKKYCCIVAAPLFVLYLLLSFTGLMAAVGAVGMLLWFVIIACVCTNWCRAKHFARTAPCADAYATPAVLPVVQAEYVAVQDNTLQQPLNP